MGRVINPNSAGKERNRLVKTVALSVRELSKQSEPGPVAHDLAAYIILALARVAETVEISVIAWEKRDYWVKADRFRMDWVWAGRSSEQMKTALLNENWLEVAQTAAGIGARLSHIKIAVRHRMGTPWVGAWEKLQSGAAIES